MRKNNDELVKLDLPRGKEFVAKEIRESKIKIIKSYIRKNKRAIERLNLICYKKDYFNLKDRKK